MFAQTIRVTVDILWLRRGPQDLPANWNLLATLAVLYLIANFIQVRTAGNAGAALVQTIFSTAVLVIYVRAALRLRQHPDRILQTLSALFAVGTLATVLLLGPTAMLAPVLAKMASGQSMAQVQVPGLALLAALVISVWTLIAYGHIYRHALDVSLPAGVLVALGFEVLLLVLFALLGGMVA